MKQFFQHSTGLISCIIASYALFYGIIYVLLGLSISPIAMILLSIIIAEKYKPVIR